MTGRFLNEDDNTVSLPPIVPPINAGSSATGEPKSKAPVPGHFIDDAVAPQGKFLPPSKDDAPLSFEDIQSLQSQGWKPTTDEHFKTIYDAENKAKADRGLWGRAYDATKGVGSAVWQGGKKLVATEIDAAKKYGASLPGGLTPLNIAKIGGHSMFQAATGTPVTRASEIEGVVNAMHSLAGLTGAEMGEGPNPYLSVLPGEKYVRKALQTPEEAFQEWKLAYMAQHPEVEEQPDTTLPYPGVMTPNWLRGGVAPDPAISGLAEQAALFAVPGIAGGLSKGLAATKLLQPLVEAGEVARMTPGLAARAAYEASPLAKSVPVGTVAGAFPRLQAALTPATSGQLGRFISGSGDFLGKIGTLPETISKHVSSKLLGSDVAEKISEKIGASELPTALVAGVLGHPVVAGVAAGFKGASKVAPVVSGFGRYMERLAQADPGQFGRLYTLARDQSAPSWMQSLSDHWATKALAATGDVAKDLGTAAAHGAVFGAALGTLPGEDLASDIGGGLGYGLLGGGLYRGRMKESRVLHRDADLNRSNYSEHIADKISPESLKKVPTDAWTWASTMQRILGPGYKIRFAGEGDAVMPATVHGQAGMFDTTSDPTVKTAWINVNANRPISETLLHEIVHPLFDAAVNEHPELAAQVNQALVESGQTLDAAKHVYVSALLAESLKGIADPAQRQAAVEAQINTYDTDSQSKSGSPDTWIHSEILAEAGSRSLYGTHPVIDVANPGLTATALQYVQTAFEKMGITFKQAKSGTILPGFENVIDSPVLRRAVYRLIKERKKLIPRAEIGEPRGVRITPEVWGKIPGAPLEQRADGTVGNDFVEQDPTTGKIVEKTKREVRKTVSTRQKEVGTIYPDKGNALPASDQTPEVALRRRLDGTTERSGIKLGPGFDSLTTIGAQTKSFAHMLEDGISEGATFESEYQQIGKESGAEGWKANVGRETGNLEVQKKRFKVISFLVDKKNNFLARVYSETAMDSKAAQWSARSGPISLDEFGGDIGKFNEKKARYLQNHAEGLPGDANGVGSAARDVINAFLVGGNRMFEARNPLRPLLKGADRQGVVRSYRLDRMATLEKVPDTLAQPDYAKQVQNMSPTQAKAKAKSKSLFAESSGLTSKGWILPNAEFVPLQGELHASFLLSQADILKKSFGADFSKYPETDANEGPRIPALNKGFVRVNYERNTGTLTIEANAKHWSKETRDSVLSIIADNAAKIDNVKIALLDDKANVKKYDLSQLFQYDDKEKLNHIPFVSEESSGRKFSPDVEKALDEASPEKVLKLSGEQFFETSTNWRNLAMEGKAPTVQDIAEQAAHQKPDRALWEAGYKQAADEARQVHAEIAANPSTMFARQREIFGAAQKAQYFSEGLKALDTPKFSPDTEKQADFRNSGLSFKNFFSQATKGEIGKSAVPWTPNMDLSKEADFRAAQAQHTGNFDEHIAKSIPGFRETQIKTGNAIVKSFPEGAEVLDIAASEGSYGKAISELSGGKIKTTSLDPNPDMAKFFAEKSKVSGATYDTSAFLNGFEDSGTHIPAYNPKKRFDVVHESMGFQFISPERAAQIAEAKRLMKPDGVMLTEQKVLNGAWAENEAHKDATYKSKYFSGEDLAKKNKIVGFQQSEQETQKVGMLDNMVHDTALEDVLAENFKHVVQYWDSGNFKGYAASDNEIALQRLVSNMGDLKTDYSTVQTPRLVTRESGLHSEDLINPQTGQYSPALDPEKEHIKIAAIRFPDGKIFTGGAHYHAAMEAEKAGYGDPASWVNTIEGFVTSEDRFVDRDEALKLAIRARQITKKDYQASAEQEGMVQKGEKASYLEALTFHVARKFSPDTVYSQAGKVIEDKFKGESMPRAQLAAMLRNPQNGVKAEEMKWFGLDDFLKGSGKITKKEVQDYLQQNQVQVKEISKGGELHADPRDIEALKEGVKGLDSEGYYREPMDADSEEILKEVYQEKINKVRGQLWEFIYAEDWSNARNRIAKLASIYEDAQLDTRSLDKLFALASTMEAATDGTGENAPDYEKYQLPGGENYREILFHLPVKNKMLRLVPNEAETAYADGEPMFDVVSNVNGLTRFTGSEAEAKKYLAEEFALGREKGYHSQHFKEPNVVAHTRVNDRTDTEGKPGLFAEEIQSDWHQTGRKEGYAITEKVNPVETVAVGEIGYGDGYRFKFMDNKVGDYLFFKTQAEAQARQAGWAHENKTSSGVPDAPFKTTWHEMVMRRLIQKAVAEGKDWLGWTTGEQQANRYDLSKQVSSIYARKREDGTFEISVIEKGKKMLTGIGGEIEADELSDYVGKDLADKMILQKPHTSPTVYDGLDLKVGSKGMLGFYDKMLVDYANKFGKRFGAKVEDRKIPGAHDASRAELFTDRAKAVRVLDGGGEVYAVFKDVAGETLVKDYHHLLELEQENGNSFAKGYYLGDKQPEMTVHSLPITPEMRKSVAATGISLFSPDVQPEMFSKQEVNPQGEKAQNVKDESILYPNRELTPNELTASNLARRELRDRVQVLPDADERIKLRRALNRGFVEVSQSLEKQAKDENFDTGADWYRKDMDAMEDTTKKIFPETKDATKMSVFKALLAALSPSAKPNENYRSGAEAFAQYLKTGKFPYTTPYRVSETGKRRQLGITAESAMGKMNELLKQSGGEKQLVAYLLTKHDVTVYGNKEAYGALDLGPKVGRFLLNLSGHGEEVTVDMWATRTFNRWMGTPFRNQAGRAELPDIPTEQERNVMIDAFTQIGETISKSTGVPMTAMDVQAVLWYLEKDLYAETSRAGRTSFADAAKIYEAKPIHTLPRQVSNEKGIRIEPKKNQPDLLTKAKKKFPTAFSPDFGFVGGVADDLAVGAAAGKLDSMTHDSEGIYEESGASFRYNQRTKTLYWWRGVSADKKDAAEAWLNKKGFEVKKHVKIILHGESWSTAHGLSPADSKDYLWRMNLDSGK